jgi:uncharacterized protein (TIRG00374 family)
MRKNIINAATGIIIGGGFMYLTLRNQPLAEIGEILSTTRVSWILFGLVVLILNFFIRAYRWKLLLKNSGDDPPIKDVFYSLLMGYFINSFTPKLGEVIRCTTLQNRTSIQASRIFGTVISERIYDVLVLLAGLLSIILIEFSRLKNLLGMAVNSIGESLSNSILRIALFIAGLVALLFILWYLARRFKLAEKIKSAARDIWATARNTFKIKRAGVFILQTLLVWFTMVIVTWACLRSLPSTEGLGLYFAYIALFAGTIGWAIPSPGGMGTSHFFVLQLFLLFNLSEDTGIAFGILVNGLTVLFTIAAGLLAIATVKIIENTRKRKSGSV